MEAAPAAAPSLPAPAAAFPAVPPCPQQSADAAASGVPAHDEEDWLKRIRSLRDAGNLPAARAELACFAAHHPAVELPPDLRGLTGSGR